MAFDFEPSIILETAPQLLGGMKLTLIITLGGLLVGLLLGVVTGLANTSRSRFLRGIAILYIEAIRGTPLIVQVMFLYFGLPLALGMRIPPDVAGVIAIGVNSGAYIAEIVRGAIQSIDKGQTEAGRSTGLTQAQTMLYIIWPQAFRRMIPPLTNQCIISLKDTSLLVVIGVALGTASLLLCLWGALVLSRQVTRPVREMTAAMKRVQMGELSARVVPHGRDELGQLAAEFRILGNFRGYEP